MLIDYLATKIIRWDSSLNRSNSIQNSNHIEGFSAALKLSGKFVLKENIGITNASNTNDLNKSKIIQNNIIKSKLRIEREDSKKFSDKLDENQPLNENFKATDENCDLTDEGSLPQDGFTWRQRRIRCINKFNFIEKSMK